MGNHKSRCSSWGILVEWWGFSYEDTEYRISHWQVLCRSRECVPFESCVLLDAVGLWYKQVTCLFVCSYFCEVDSQLYISQFPELTYPVKQKKRSFACYVLFYSWGKKNCSSHTGTLSITYSRMSLILPKELSLNELWELMALKMVRKPILLLTVRM